MRQSRRLGVGRPPCASLILALFCHWTTLASPYTYTVIVDGAGDTGFCREYDGTSQGTFVRTNSVADLASCFLLCDAEPLCTGAEYVTSSGACEVHTGSICKVSANSGAGCYLTGESNPAASNPCPNLPPPPSPPPQR